MIVSRPRFEVTLEEANIRLAPGHDKSRLDPVELGVGYVIVWLETFVHLPGYFDFSPDSAAEPSHCSVPCDSMPAFSCALVHASLRCLSSPDAIEVRPVGRPESVTVSSVDNLVKLDFLYSTELFDTVYYEYVPYMTRLMNKHAQCIRRSKDLFPEMQRLPDSHCLVF